MADALISPAVGGTMLAVSAGLIGYCSKKVKAEADERTVPLMGVMGAFIFAAQMINFTIPATGSSGHLGGGLLLAVLLGPHAAFLVISSVLVIQGLFFADGGLLALGCNIFNLGFFPAFLAYPFLYKKIVKDKPSSGRIITGSLLAAVVGLQLGAFSVVIETVCSGITALPLSVFTLLMQPIHLAIGMVEGLVTAAVLSFIWKANPGILDLAPSPVHSPLIKTGHVVATLLVAAAVTGGFMSWFASGNPDGLEWSIEKVTGKQELETAYHLQHTLAGIQEKTALLPDYSFRTAQALAAQAGPEQDQRLGTSISGIAGGLFTLCLAALIGWGLKKRTAKPG